MLAGLLSGIFWFSAFFLGHIAVFRIARPGQRSRVILRSFAAALAGHLVSLGFLALAAPAVLSSLDSRPLLSAGVGVILMLCLFVLYMPAYYVINTSLSVETLAMLAKAQNGRIGAAALERCFTSPEFVRDRLQTMEANGYLRKSGADQWTMNEGGRRVALALSAIKRLLVLGPGG